MSDESDYDSVTSDNSVSTDSHELEEMSSEYVPDCLVMKLIEYEKYSPVMSRSDLKRYRDIQLFVLYDTNKGTFIIRGKRTSTTKVNAKPFSFECRHSREVYEFIKFILSCEHVFTLELYNLDDLPTNSNEITFKSLNRSLDLSSLIVAYDKQLMSNDSHRGMIHKCISSLENVNNVYSSR
jgi:hypothetical protein